MFKLLIPFLSVALTALWYPAIKPVFSEITPLQAATIEAAACFVCAGVWLLITKENIKTSRQILLIGFLNGIGSLLVYSSLNLLTPVDSAVLGRNYTIICIILAVIVLKERISMRKWILILGSIVGSTFFVYNDSFGRSNLLGILMVLGHTIFFAVANLLAKESLKKLSPVAILFYTKLITFLTLFPLGLTSAGTDFFTVSLEPFLYVIVVSILSMFIGMILYYQSIALMKFSYINVIRGSAPLFVFLYSIPFFQNELTLINIVFGVLLVVSIILLSLEDNKEDNQKKIQEELYASKAK